MLSGGRNCVAFVQVESEVVCSLDALEGLTYPSSNYRSVAYGCLCMSSCLPSSCAVKVSLTLTTFITLPFLGHAPWLYSMAN